MKILYISSDDDYGFLTFENQSESVKQEVIEKCKNEPGKTHSFDVNDEYGEEAQFYAKYMEFGYVDPKFVEYMESLKDNDVSIHKNWIVID